jgi:hypothetical protein
MAATSADLTEEGRSTAACAESSRLRRPKQRQHRSHLPDALWLLTFAPPFQLRKPREVLQHPYTLYTLGIAAGLIAGTCTVAFDVLYGYWTTGITDAESFPGAIYERARVSGWLMTIVGVVAVGSFGSFLALCTSSPDYLGRKSSRIRG